MIEQILNNALKYARGKDIWITFDQQQHVLTIQIMASVLVKLTYRRSLIKAIQDIMVD